MNDFVTNNQLLASLILILTALFVRWLAIRYLQQIPRIDNELPRRWTNIAKNATSTLIVIGLIIIWLSELRFVALSIAAFAAALVIATRDFIQCFLGALYQTTTRAFVIGDWIQVGEQSGEVISSDWLTTELLEIDLKSATYSYTGKTIVIPNNKFVNEPIYNLNSIKRYVTHTFTITREADTVNVFDIKEYILEKANIYCEPFEDIAKRYGSPIQKHLGIQLSNHQANVRVTTTNLGKNEFQISIVCPTTDAVSIEQKLTDDFMKFWYAAINKPTKHIEVKDVV